MPRRLLRDGILRSKRVNSLSSEAELFYRRLMSVVDDFGRYEADPEVLLSVCYPINRRGICVADVSQMLCECVATAPQLVLIYDIGDSSYLEVVNFNQQTRSKPKFPGPEKGILRRRCVPDATQLVQEDVITKTKTETFSEDGNLSVIDTVSTVQPLSATGENAAHSTEVQEAAPERAQGASVGVDRVNGSKKRKLPGQTKLEYEIWQREQEAKGRLQ